MYDTEMPVSDFAFEEDRLRDMVRGDTNKLDAQLHVQFYKRAELNCFRTEKEGRKIFDEFVYIRILMPANRLNEIDRRATDEDKLRFKRQFKAFVEKGEVLQIGTPLDQMPNISAAQVLELKYLHIETVEQLAGIPDSTVSTLGTGGQTLKQTARALLDRTADSVKLSEENRDLRKQLDEVLVRIAALEPMATSVKTTTTVVAPAVKA
jgi:hypothetical protein